ncbi:hypothetical protein FACS1894166_06420 [Bacilli bacterium]|nr:hypothetical protein FACS1894166_06420 [Bacilli bacterium]
MLKQAGLTQYLDRDDVRAKIDAKYQCAKQIHEGDPVQLVKDETNYKVALQD